jgi:hypothetical protein
MSIEKNEEVYEQVEAWMIGQTVEVGVYKQGAGDNVVSTNGGVLIGYSYNNEVSVFIFTGSGDAQFTVEVPAKQSYLISVVEPSPR